MQDSPAMSRIAPSPRSTFPRMHGNNGLNQPLNTKSRTGPNTLGPARQPLRRIPMTKLALLAAAALLSAAVAAPAVAQEVVYNPDYCAQFYPNANCQNKGSNSTYTGDH
jgi:hypothetical protein